jgi:methionine-S-sulfoxide reductase
MAMADAKPKTEIATFAGGCFWCMQPTFNEFHGVISTKVGYTGGHTVNPTYEEVCTGTTGHAEGIEIIYDPSKVTYSELVEEFWHNIDPTSLNQQFADHGTQYRSAIFYHNAEQKRIAEASKERLAKSGKFKKPIVTEITPASTFYPAEEYHQDYYKKNAMHYKAYKIGSGRQSYIEDTWGKSH